jgi:hypothetical protein
MNRSKGARGLRCTPNAWPTLAPHVAHDTGRRTRRAVAAVPHCAAGHLAHCNAHRGGGSNLCLGCFCDPLARAVRRPRQKFDGEGPEKLEL